MELRKYDHLWQQEELSDVDIVLTGPQQGASTDGPGTCRLTAFPGHIVLLSDSPFFKAQILRWQNKRQHEEAFDSPAEADQAAADAPASSSRRPQLVLTLDAADQQPAALAVLQSLYYVQPGSALLLELSQEQQLQAALLADMWQVPGAGRAAADALAAAAADGQLSEAVTQKLLSMQAVPACRDFTLLLHKVLMSVFGDLEAVWADGTLLQQLLGLPLHAIKLLLSCDTLKVATEDTVLCTVRRYVKEHPDTPALEQLMSVVRCPHLSIYWLSTLATSRIPVPAELLPHLSNLLSARSLQADCKVTGQGLRKMFSDAPASWALPQRAIQPVSSVQVTWELPISEVQQAMQSCTAVNKRVKLFSPDCTPPIDGMQYRPVVTLDYRPEVAGSGFRVRMGLFAAAYECPDGSCWCCSFKIDVPGTPVTTGRAQPDVGVNLCGRFGCGLPSMAGGWDEMAWAAMGLPTNGTLPITLTVYAQRRQ